METLKIQKEDLDNMSEDQCKKLLDELKKNQYHCLNLIKQIVRKYPQHKSTGYQKKKKPSE
jgi:hypothetical protein